MCQIEGRNEETPKERSSISMNKACMKCDKPATLVARIHDPFCRDCFLVYFTHRFRATFGKSKAVRNGEKVLIAFSGGQSSCAMLHLVKEGLADGVPKKLRYQPGAIYIDESVCLEELEDDTHIEQIKSLLKGSSFPAYISSIDEVMREPADEVRVVSADSSGDMDDALGNLTLDHSLKDKFLILWKSASTLTTKEDLLHCLRLKLLKHVAKKLGYTKIMCGESRTRLATSILTNLAKGRGSAISQEISFLDERDESVSVLRPMREFSSKEIAMYNYQCGLQHVFIPTISTKSTQFASINTLTETFINGLQSNFPATVSTVLKTGEKLTSDKKDAQVNGICLLCQSHIDTSSLPCSANAATDYSHSIQRLAPSTAVTSSYTCNNPSTLTCCGQGDGSCQSLSNKTDLTSNLDTGLCYGCRVMIRDVTDLDSLPSSLITDIRRHGRRKEIGEFLLDDER